MIPPIVSSELHARLFNDDLPMEFSECSVEQLDAWVEKNILHATSSCPQVMMHWRRDKDTGTTRVLHGETQLHWERRLCRYIAAAMENAGERKKFLVMDGQCFEKGPMTLSNYLLELNERQEIWSVLSPSWSETPGTVLRNKATELGWTPYSLMAQSYAGLSQALTHGSEPPVWAAFVRYPHSLMVLHRYLANPQTQDRPVTMSAPWADPVDVALACCLAQSLFSPETFSFVKHANVQKLDLEHDKRVQGLIHCHMGLGTIESELVPCLVANELPILLGQAAESIELPEMETGR